MCRLAAYIGSPISLEEIIIKPNHSLLTQSMQAQEAKLAVNGDGFGIAWYGEPEEPGLYREEQPAWSNGNLVSLGRHIHSHLFLAHVRASTTGETARSNCHPFVHGHWSFMHNGQLGQFERIRRTLEAQLSDDLYSARRGTTDSELIFLLLLQMGLENDPEDALRNVLSLLYSELDTLGFKPFLRLTCAFSNGERLYGFRHASDGNSPTLYLSETFTDQGTVLASEPLDDRLAGWVRVEPDELIVLDATKALTALE